MKNLGRSAAVVVLCLCALALGPALASAGAPGPLPIGVNAPYEYLGWGDPQPPVQVMKATGITQFTMAFMLSDGTCNPEWDGYRPLLGGVDQAAIDKIRANGGDVVVSFGGWSGQKLGVVCPNRKALAAAYLKVVDAYRLKAIDIDIEHTEMYRRGPRHRVAKALAIVHQKDPSLRIFMTIGTNENGPDSTGKDLIRKLAAEKVHPDWTIMPFDFGVPVTNMGKVSIRASEGLKRDLMAAYHESADAAYATMGISSMNGVTDESDEVVTTQDFQEMLAYALEHHLARFTFWSVNRDRPCGTGSDADSCSGIDQAPYAFTKIVAQFHG
ncbi:MAG TPA: chitinase [Actinomycetota bacterium]|nr:chitinase [Actinomycetota bacterium]